MSLLRKLGLQKLCRPVLASEQRVVYSSLSDLIKNAKATVESTELKKTVEELKRNAEALRERTRSAAEDLRKSASDAANQATQQVRGAAANFSDAASSSKSQDSDSTGAAENQGGCASSERKSTHASASSSSTNEDGPSSSDTSRKTGSTFSNRPPIGVRLRRAFDFVRKEVQDAVLPRQEAVSATKARDPGVRPSGNPTSSAVSVVKQQESRWQKQWAEMQDKLGLHPIFQRLRGLSNNRVFNKGREVADDLRERWETSDSPLVQRIQDMKDSMFVETEQAQALREIRSRYPGFDMVQFVRTLKWDVPVVIKAYLESDLEALNEHCAPEMMERFSGIVAAQKAEGLTTDSTILDVGDVELVDLKFVDRNPVVVVQFTCQQINCTRDRFGNVVEGGPQDVQRVYYYWALQQDDSGFVGEDGKFHPPRWQLREMMVRGMHNLL